MFFYVKKFLFLFFIFTSLSSVSMERESNLFSPDALNNNVPLQLLTAEERIERACLCPFEEMPHDVQNKIACDMLADFFIVPQRILSDSQDIQSLSMYGDTIATSHACPYKHGDLLHERKGKIKIWYKDGTLLQTFKCPGGVPKVSIGKDKLVAALNDEVIVVDLDTGQSLYSFENEKNIESLTLSDNKIIVISRPKINIWEIQNGKLKKPNKIDTCLSHLLNKFSHFAISNGKIVGTDGTIAQIWNMATGKLEHTLVGHADKIIRIAVENNKVVTQSRDHVTKVWDMHTGKLLHTLMCYGGNFTISGDTLIAKPFDAGGINMWSLLADFNAPEFNDFTHALFWIKNNVLSLQANLIARAYEKAQTKNPLVIYADTQDACIWVTFPAHVREYLMKRLNMYITNKKPGTFFISKDAQVLNIIIDFLTMATGIKVWPPYIDDCDLREFNDSNHALFWIKHEMKIDQADLIARAYAESQAGKPFIIKFGTDESFLWVKIPQHVRDYVRKYLDIKHTR